MFKKYQRDIMTYLFIVFVLILFPQMSNILLLESVSLTQQKISNRIMFPYYLYVVLYLSSCYKVVTFKSFTANSGTHIPT